MKVFISYHRADTRQKCALTDFLDSRRIQYYCVPENYSFDGMYHEHIAQVIIDNMGDCDVTICIVGAETYTRPHVDHEIKATLRGGVETRKGLVVVMLENRRDSIREINYDTFPNRIQDNLGYCELIQRSSMNQLLIPAIQKAISKSRSITNR